MLPLKFSLRLLVPLLFLTAIFLFWHNAHHYPTVKEFVKNFDLQIHPQAVVAPSDVRANATFVILVRNQELDAIIDSITQLEYHFNKRFQYPYVFLNDAPFTDEFKNRTQKVISGKAQYGTISHDDWNQPESIDEERAKASRDEMSAKGVPYADSVPYRNMCRFNSGFFYRHPLMQQYRYYWRVEPGVKFFCDVHEDPFTFMEANNKTYGFTISLKEFEATIPSLWETTKDFVRKHPEYVAPDNAMGFVTNDEGESYNLCHFWSNFEIADMELWRSPAYTAYFEHLDAAGGFYYERWGDAPVHTMGATLFSSKDQIHFFKPIGYRHDPFQHCPQGWDYFRNDCECDKNDNFDDNWYSCTSRWKKLYS